MSVLQRLAVSKYGMKASTNIYTEKEQYPSGSAVRTMLAVVWRALYCTSCRASSLLIALSPRLGHQSEEAAETSVNLVLAEDR